MKSADGTTLHVLPAPKRPLEDYIAKAQIAWAQKHAPWLLAKVA